MKPEFRENAQQMGDLLVGTPAGRQISLSELSNIHEASAESFIYRENNSRYIGVQYSIESRDLESAVLDGQRAIDAIERPYRRLSQGLGAGSTANSSKPSTRWRSSGRLPC